MRGFATACAAAALALSATAGSAGMKPSEVAYKNGAVPTPLTDTPGDPERGREVIGTKSLGNCVSCHKISEMSEVPWHGEVGPPLDGAGDRWTEAELRGIVANAKMMFEGSMMPSFYKVDGFIRPGDGFTGKAAGEITPLLTAQQIEDVVAYLETLEY
jgi:sulfur-oxidizing protein SoxX